MALSSCNHSNGQAPTVSAALSGPPSCCRKKSLPQISRRNTVNYARAEIAYKEWVLQQRASSRRWEQGAGTRGTK